MAPLKLPDGVALRSPSPGPPNWPVYIDGSPWLKFCASVASLGIQGSLIFEAAGFEAKTTTGSGTSTSTELTVMTTAATNSIPLTALETIFGRLCLNNYKKAEKISSTAMRLRSLIPEKYDGQHFRTARTLCDHSKTLPPEEVMIQLFLLGNNFTLRRDGVIDYPGHDERIISLLYQLGQNGLQHIKRLLSIQNPVSEAIKEQLFASILRSEDLAMLQFILTTTVDVNVNIRDRKWGFNMTPIAFAAVLKMKKSHWVSSAYLSTLEPMSPGEITCSLQSTALWN